MTVRVDLDELARRENEQTEWKENVAEVDKIIGISIEARNRLLRELPIRKGVMESWDRRPCPGATVSDLDLLALRDAPSNGWASIRWSAV